MKYDFCQAIIERKHLEMEKLVNDYLETIDSSKNGNQKLESFKNWIQSHECVIKVEDDPALIATEPAVKEYSVYLKGIPQPFPIGIRLAPKKWRFDIKKQ